MWDERRANFQSEKGGWITFRSRRTRARASDARLAGVCYFTGKSFVCSRRSGSTRFEEGLLDTSVNQIGIFSFGDLLSNGRIPTDDGIDISYYKINFGFISE